MIKKIFWHIFAISSVLFFSCNSSKKISAIEAEQESRNSSERPVYRGSETKTFDLIHTKLQLVPDWENQYLYGTAYITVSPHWYSSNQLILDARAMILNEVDILFGDKLEELAYSYDSSRIYITLDKYYSRTDTITLLVDYIARPEEAERSKGHAIRSDKGLYFINADGSDNDKPMQIWTQGETENNSVWFPTIDGPDQKMTQEIYLTVDTAFQTLSNGLLKSSLVNETNGTRTDYWAQELPHAPYLAMICVGKYAVVRDQWNGKPVDYYVEPDYEPYAKDIFRHTTQMLSFFSNLYKVEYPWEKFSQVIVRDYVSGAMENTTAVVYGEFVQQDSRAIIDRDYEDYVSHEMTHHWFGDLVTCESWSNIPLNESFANYGEYLWFEKKYGRDFADYHSLQDLRAYITESRSKKVNLIRYDYNKADDMYDRHSYEKGGRVLHMLRCYVGDEAYFEACRLYLTENRFGTAEIHDLRMAFEQVTGEDLNWFFDQWFFSKGHPVLKIDHVYLESEDRVVLNVSQVQDLSNSVVFRLPVSVDIYTDSGIKRYEIVIDSIRKEFSFPVSGKPLLVNFDAKKMLLCEKQVKQTVDEDVYQYLNAPLFMDRFESLATMESSLEKDERIQKTFVAALKDPSPTIRGLVVEYSPEYFKVDRNLWTNELKQLLATEKSADVIYATINAFVNDDFPQRDPGLIDLISQHTNDLSYDVQEIAINYLLSVDKEKWIGEVKKIDTIPNMRLRETSMYLYSMYGDEDEFEYMSSIISGETQKPTSGEIKYFGTYLMNCDPQHAKQGVDILGDLGLSSEEWSIRYIVYKELNEISGNYSTRFMKEKGIEAERNQQLASGVKKNADAILQKMRAKETNPLLQKAFGK